MKILLTIPLLLLVALPVLAQDSTHVPAEAYSEPARITEKYAVSETPSIAELYDVLSRSGGEYKQAIGSIARRGDAAVPALVALLDARFEAITGENMASVVPPPDKCFAVYALEAIGTPKAADALTNIALTHSDPRVRAFAVDFLENRSADLYKSLHQEPPLAILEALVFNLGDQQYTPELQSTLAASSQRALQKWLGLDFADASFRKDREAEDIMLTPAEYAQKWWTEHRSDLVWSSASARFQVK